MKRNGLLFIAILIILVAAACTPGAGGLSPTTTAGFDHYVQGLRLETQQQFQQAVDEFSQAISANPKNELAFYARGNAYGALGMQDKAIADFRQAIALNPKDDPSYFGLAIAFANQGKRSDAIAALDKAISIASSNGEYYGLRGTLYAEQNDPQHAIADLEKALSLGLDAQQKQSVQSLLQKIKSQTAP